MGGATWGNEARLDQVINGGELGCDKCGVKTQCESENSCLGSDRSHLLLDEFVHIAKTREKHNVKVSTLTENSD